MALNRYTCKNGGDRWNFRWSIIILVYCFNFLILAEFVESRSIVEVDRSMHHRSLDGLQLHGNQFVRGVPCETACEHCGCKGIYLGDKCICSCGADNKETTNCLSAIRKNELRAGIDNDILILTRTGARFARDIRQVASLRARMGRGASAAWNTKRNVDEIRTGNNRKFNKNIQ